MGDAENNAQHSKKRAAGVQLSRENPGLDDDQETGEEDSGTFKRASEDVLATRRIVKVRRQPASTTSAPADPPTSSNPFAAIRLVPATSTASTAPEGLEREDSVKSEENKETKESSLVEEPKGESALITEKTPSGGDNVKQSESTGDNSQGGVHAQNDDTDAGKLEDPNSGAEEVAQCQDSEDGEKKSKDADNSKKEVEGSEGEGNNDEKEKELPTTEKNQASTNFSSFGQLSSNQNAFSGLSGTGFSSTSFSFGSIPKDGSSQGSSIFGVFNNGSSANFGTGSNSFSKNEGSSKITPMPEVSVETGEENEEAVFAADSVLYEFSDGSWKERGKGELKVNISREETLKTRLVMRTRGNFRLILNASLFPDMKLTSMEKKGITFACVNSAGEGKDVLSTFALKFKDASIVSDFRAAVMEYKAKTSAAMKTPENSPKATD